MSTTTTSPIADLERMVADAVQAENTARAEWAASFANAPTETNDLYDAPLRRMTTARLRASRKAA